MENVVKLLEETVDHVLDTYVEKGSTVIVGVSGGADSMALLNLMLKPAKEQDITIVVAHVNHLLRGKDSDGDEVFVKKHAVLNDLDYVSEKVDVREMHKKQKLSLEDAGRQARYSFFYRLKEEYNASHIILAHHRDDNVETILMNLIRGSGVRGLSGMQMLSKDILRPLIDFSKEELQEYCHKKSVAFREDKTNSDTDIRRNYIRHKLIPGIEKVNKNFRELLHRKSFYFEEIDNLLTIMAFDFIKKNCLAEGKNISCNIAGFKKVAPAIQRAVIQTIYEMFHGSTKGLTFDQIEELIKTIYNDRTGTEKFLGDRLSLTIEYGKAIFQREIEKRESSLPDRILQIPVPGVITYTGGRIITRYKKELPKRKKKNSIYLSAKNKEIQIFMRRFQPGDRLNPYGMNGSKKIQDLFVDAKIPRSIRKDVPIITDENGKIMAVGKLRVDRSFHPQMIPGFIVEIEFREGDDK